MPKTKIKVTVKNEEENKKTVVPAILQDDILKYTEEDNTIVKYHYRKNILTRENQELEMKYRFDPENKTIGEIHIKELGQSVKIEIKTKKLKRKENNIEIIFLVEGKEFLYRIEEVK